ncbi:serine hydrolase domain-containing protein [Comamonas sp.]|uniref:serine hydrolase domain-containing protein n=1 Tax=Comamonas sp. TaxID=34028 RepID=UPI003A909DE1
MNEQPVAEKSPLHPTSAQPVTKANWLAPAHIRWAMRNARMVVPTAGVRHSNDSQIFAQGDALSLDDLTLQLPHGRSATWAQYLDGNRVDALLVLHKGRVVFESYYGGMQEHDAHGWASMSKSVIGLLAAQFIEEGRMEASAPLARYVPELAGTPFGSATVQQNLDMEVALTYLPELPPDIGLFTAAGLMPAREGMPSSINDFLLKATRPVDSPHGSIFYYQNGSTEAVARALKNISSRTLAQLVSERIWQPMGAEDDAYFSVDSRSVELASGGLSSTLRDAARFGELVRNRGQRDGQQVIAIAALMRVLQTPSADNQERLSRAGRAQTGYGNFWWHPADTDGAVYASGRFGQRLFIDPANELTIAQFGSYADTRARTISGDQGVAPHENSLRSGDSLVALARAVATRLRETGK